MPYKNIEDRRANARRPENAAKRAAYLARWRKANPDYFNKRLEQGPHLFLRQLVYYANLRKKGRVALEDVVALWDKQRGKCAVTGVKMTHLRRKELFDTNVSIDRIDNKRGYSTENIRLVCRRVNAMRSDLDHDVFVKWCRLVTRRK